MKLSQNYFAEILNSIIGLQMSPYDILHFLSMYEGHQDDTFFDPTQHFKKKATQYALLTQAQDLSAKNNDQWDTHNGIEEKICFLGETLFREVGYHLKGIPNLQMARNFKKQPIKELKPFMRSNKELKEGIIFIYQFHSFQIQVYDLQIVSIESLRQNSIEQPISRAIILPNQEPIEGQLLTFCTENVIKIFQNNVSQGEVAAWMISEYLIKTKLSYGLVWTSCISKIQSLGIVNIENIDVYFNFRQYKPKAIGEGELIGSGIALAIQIINFAYRINSEEPELSLLQVCKDLADIQELNFVPSKNNLVFVLNANISNKILSKQRDFLIITDGQNYSFEKINHDSYFEVEATENLFPVSSPKENLRYNSKLMRIRKGISSVSKYLQLSKSQIRNYLRLQASNSAQITFGTGLFYPIKILRFFKNIQTLLLNCLLYSTVEDFSYFPEKHMLIYRSHYEKFFDEANDSVEISGIFIFEEYLIIKNGKIFLVKVMEKTENLNELEELIQTFDAPNLERPGGPTQIQIYRHVQTQVKSLQQIRSELKTNISLLCFLNPRFDCQSKQLCGMIILPREEREQTKIFIESKAMRNKIVKDIQNMREWKKYNMGVNIKRIKIGDYLILPSVLQRTGIELSCRETQQEFISKHLIIASLYQTIGKIPECIELYEKGLDSLNKQQALSESIAFVIRERIKTLNWLSQIKTQNHKTISLISTTLKHQNNANMRIFGRKNHKIKVVQYKNLSPLGELFNSFEDNHILQTNSLSNGSTGSLKMTN